MKYDMPSDLPSRVNAAIGAVLEAELKALTVQLTERYRAEFEKEAAAIAIRCAQGLRIKALERASYARDTRQIDIQVHYTLETPEGRKEQ